MSLQTLSEWLRCPNCFHPLRPGAPLTLVCEAGHSFDVNKRGFVSLLAGSAGLIGDGPAMLDARARFLDSGWYSPLRDALAGLVAAAAPARVLDVGCGTGYYLKGVLARGDATRALGLDLSPAAVARTVRGQERVDGLVADVWSPLPVRDATADAILNVFAPRNAAEFHRVLRPDGLLAVVVPQDTHLLELREAGLALDVQANKSARLAASLGAHFELASRRELAWTLSLAAADVAALLGMGPSAHHTDTAPLPEDDGSRRPVTAAFELFGFRRRAR